MSRCVGVECEAYSLAYIKLKVPNNEAAAIEFATSDISEGSTQRSSLSRYHHRATMSYLFMPRKGTKYRPGATLVSYRSNVT